MIVALVVEMTNMAAVLTSMEDRVMVINMVQVVVFLTNVNHDRMIILPIVNLQLEMVNRQMKMMHNMIETIDMLCV